METRPEENGLPNILIADSARVEREIFTEILTQSRRYHVVDAVDSADEAAEICLSGNVDIVVMDEMSSGGMDGFAAAARIKSRRPSVRMILMTSACDDALPERARAAGADSFWYKNHSRESFIEIVDRTGAGESVYPDVEPDGRIGNALRSDFGQTELTILRAMMNGRTAEKIASEIGMSADGVRYHIKSMLKKTGLPSRVALMVSAARCGIIV